ncbi:fimbria/pilus periplasmic chaperone [Ewingella americana]|jgi:chaperone protein EcpD|uniref:fimbria/pilus periplasmic chaperone n=1 Tax=Ewingella americana TaxID=41202 RepID=UPI0012AE074F|nr:fimbria/pilus periplasmic chaperone [Ewingella americana]MRT03461.1 fimbria/pilus periplasmic chaperone [Ewingella americana]
MKQTFSTLIKFLGITILCLTSLSSWASIIITGTRVIYPSTEKEVTVKLNNVGVSPVLVQSWIDNGDVNAKPENISVPFVLTPPINRVEQGKGQTLRVTYTGAPLPANKESVFWLNVLEIPAKAKGQANENMLQMAFRSRIKLFFRPAGLAGNPNDGLKTLTWQSSAGGVKASNPTPYFVSLVKLDTQIAGKRGQVEGDMVAPFSSTEFRFPGIAAIPAGSKITFSAVNDYGAIVNADALVK